MAFVADKTRDMGEVDIVVNNAGYFPNRSIDELDFPTWRKTLATNLRFTLSKREIFLPGMRRKKWGRFVGISSNMVGLAIAGMSHYIATKMGIIGFMRGLANDVANDGITANAVLPGLTSTQATALQSEEQKHGTWQQQTIKRLEQPEDVTGAVLFLTSDDAAFITGQAIVVDGGRIELDKQWGNKMSLCNEFASCTRCREEIRHVRKHIELTDPKSSRCPGENDPARRRAAIDEIWAKDGVFYDQARALSVAAMRSIASRAQSRLLMLTFDIR